MRLPHSSTPNHHYHGSGSSGSSGSIFLTRTYCLLVLVTAVPAFFLGTVVTLWAGLVDLECSSSASSMIRQGDINNNNNNNIHNGNLEQLLQQEKLQWQKDQDQILREAIARVRQEERLAREVEGAKGAQQSDNNNNDKQQCPEDEKNYDPRSLFPADTMSRFAVGMARVRKQDFVEHLDLGVPIDLPQPGYSDVLLLYQRANTLPLQFADKQQQQQSSVPLLEMPDALQHCDFVNVMLTDHSGTRKQCTAIVPQYESYHLQKWMRLHTDSNNKKGQLVDSEKGETGQLQLVSRGRSATGKDEFAPPKMRDTRKNWNMLQNYLQNVDDILVELKAILEEIAVNNTVIVMVCNFGQAELLMNFVCSSKSRGFDISNILVFTTDQETTDLAEALGLKAYFDKRNFGDIPTEAARRYGDARFVAMMMAKVISVQLVSMLGYDFLFQDVDVVWFKNPLEYFQNESGLAQNYDIFFQDDGGHSIRYAPYSANSGFYFVRHNDRTRHFLTSLLMTGDLVLSTDSHQQALIALLAEHVSLYGLKAKVLSRDTEEFPGGYQFHQKSHKYMKDFFAGQVHPYIFHMSWTMNKDNKLLFFKQMGEWFTQEQCIGKKLAEIGADDLLPTCCSAEPLISCHYKDKPSKVPCPDSPNIDKGRKSFW